MQVLQQGPRSPAPISQWRQLLRISLAWTRTVFRSRRVWSKVLTALSEARKPAATTRTISPKTRKATINPNIALSPWFEAQRLPILGKCCWRAPGERGILPEDDGRICVPDATGLSSCFSRPSVTADPGQGHQTQIQFRPVAHVSGICLVLSEVMPLATPRMSSRAAEKQKSMHDKLPKKFHFVEKRVRSDFVPYHLVRIIDAWLNHLHPVHRDRTASPFTSRPPTSGPARPWTFATRFFGNATLPRNPMIADSYIMRRDVIFRAFVASRTLFRRAL